MNKTLKKLEIKRISVDHVHLWNQCPAAWAARYLYGLRPAKSAADKKRAAILNVIKESILTGTRPSETQCSEQIENLSDYAKVTAWISVGHAIATLRIYEEQHGDPIDTGLSGHIEAVQKGTDYPAPLTSSFKRSWIHLPGPEPLPSYQKNWTAIRSFAKSAANTHAWRETG